MKICIISKNKSMLCFLLRNIFFVKVQQLRPYLYFCNSHLPFYFSTEICQHTAPRFPENETSFLTPLSEFSYWASNSQPVYDKHKSTALFDCEHLSGHYEISYI